MNMIHALRKFLEFLESKRIFQVILNDAKDIVEPFAIYIAQLIHLFLQFWPAQFLLDYSILPYESM